MSLHQTSLEDAYGGKPFGTRTPIRESTPDKSKPIEPKGEERAQSLVQSLVSTLPLDTTPPPVAEGFKLRVEEPARIAVRERFHGRAPAADEDKISRILRLIEQNRTGYERPAVQDMILYVFTGVFFLFTLDTFVMLGKSMRKIQRT
jgi:hypothetical protein